MTKTKKIVIISLLCSISVALDIFTKFIPFLNLPNGGSVNISLMPIMVVSFILGIKEGILCSFLSYLLSFAFGLNNIFLSIPQYTLDYLVPVICVGGCGLFYKNKNVLEMEIGIFISMLLRTTSLVISGAYFWVESTIIAGSIGSYIGSIAYNVPYSFITMIVLMISVPIVVKMVNKYLI